VAAHGMFELAYANRHAVAVTADANGSQAAVGDERAGGNRGHTSVYGVEAVAVAQEVGGRLAATADAAQFDDLGLIEAKFPDGIDDALADAVVTAAFAERGGTSAVFCFLQPKRIGSGCSRSRSLRSIHEFSPL